MMHQSVAGSVAGRLKTTLQNSFILFYTVLLEIKNNHSLSVFIGYQGSSDKFKNQVIT